MLSTEEFWSRKQFDPAGPNSTNNPGVIPSNNIEQWLIARQRIGKQNEKSYNMKRLILTEPCSLKRLVIYKSFRL